MSLSHFNQTNCFEAPLHMGEAFCHMWRDSYLPIYYCPSISLLLCKMYLWLILFKCVTTSNVNIYCFLQGFILFNSQPLFFVVVLFVVLIAYLSTGLIVDFTFFGDSVACHVSSTNLQPFFFFPVFVSTIFFFSNLSGQSSTVNTCNRFLYRHNAMPTKSIHPTQRFSCYNFQHWMTVGVIRIFSFDTD